MLAKILKLIITPFRYLIVNFYYGTISIFRGLFSLSKFLLLFLFNFLGYFIKGVMFLMQYIFKIVVFVVKYVFLFVVKVLEILAFIIRKIYQTVVFLLYNAYLGIIYISVFIFYIFKFIFKYIIKFFEFIYLVFYNFCLGIVFVIKSIVKFLAYIFKIISDIINAIYLFIKKLFTKIYALIKKAILSVYSTIKKFLNLLYRKFIKEYLNNIINSIKKCFNEITSLIKKKMFAAKEKRKKKREERQRILEQKRLERERINKEKLDRILEKRRLRDLEKKKQFVALLEKKSLKSKAQEKEILEKREKERKEKEKRDKIRTERINKREQIRKAQEEAKKQNKLKKRTLKQKLIDWYNNLYFVRDAKNRKELSRQALLIDFEGEDAARSEEKIMYKYVAKNNETGKIEKGTFAAFSKLDVHSYLLSENYEVYEINAVRKVGITIFVTKIKKADLVFFLTQLSTFLKSGLPLVDSVKILEKQTRKRSYKNIYRSIIYELTMGENFSEALSKQGESFPRLLTNMIKTAELTGNLPETLDDMADYYQETEKTRKQMVSAMMYPAVILVFAVIVIIIILIFVIPEFVSIYTDMNSELPSITLFIINASKFLKNNIFYVLLGIVGIVIFFRVMYTTIKVFRTLMQWIFMHIPVMGKIIIYNEITMFTKTFGSLLNHNVFITESMEVLSKITNNEIYKMIIFDTMTNISRGDPISSSFKNHWAFPIVAYEMLLTGERTGQLGPMMDKVAAYYQEQHRVAVNQIKTFIEPIMIVFLTVIVGIILLSIILPMFNMYEIVG